MLFRSQVNSRDPDGLSFHLVTLKTSDGLLLHYAHIERQTGWRGLNPYVNLISTGRGLVNDRSLHPVRPNIYVANEYRYSAPKLTKAILIRSKARSEALKAPQVFRPDIFGVLPDLQKQNRNLVG